MAGTPTISEKVLDLVGFATSALDKADAEMQKAAELNERVEAAIPAAVEALVESGCIRETEREKAAEVLRNPEKAVSLLQKVAQHKKEKAEETPQFGRGAGQTKAASHSLTSPTPGLRTRHVKESDVVLFRKLGLPEPTTTV